MRKLEEAKRVFDVEIKALTIMRDSLDTTFCNILDILLECKGKVVVTGVGKSGHIGRKIASTLSSLGTSSFFMHPDEALHGDLGMVSQADVVFIISYSGESDEVLKMIPALKLIGATLIAITGNMNSTLAGAADFVQVLPKVEEACYLGLAPTSSTTMEMVYGDALAIAASVDYGFKDADFGRLHPAGALGRKTTFKVDDVMTSGEKNSVVPEGTMLKDAIVELSRKGLGIVSVVDFKGKLKGVITDGDLRRQLEKEVNIYCLSVEDVMTVKPKFVQSGQLAVEALGILKKHNISAVPVLNQDTLIGTIRLQDIIGIGIV